MTTLNAVNNRTLGRSVRLVGAVDQLICFEAACLYGRTQLCSSTMVILIYLPRLLARIGLYCVNRYCSKKKIILHHEYSGYLHNTRTIVDMANSPSNELIFTSLAPLLAEFTYWSILFIFNNIAR